MFKATLPCPEYTNQYSWQWLSSQRTGLNFLFPVSTGGSPGHQVFGPLGGTSAAAVPTDSVAPDIATPADSIAAASILFRFG
ncbi:hypothetical protein BST17_06250 [Mycolicibacterium bacteremicum]|uniref:Uncharacterized protein n=1 Tax=Mycolicibacterium bacteremicum TaxID=564198 RepID=A0A1W9Z0S9_MYCBA|nr:hypothetical protein BST17_06250 [Mycolicibacterium bacteremicum]